MVEMPKPNGGTRLLRISTVIDKMIYQTIDQGLTFVYKPKFSNSSYGFREGRSQNQVINKFL